MRKPIVLDIFCGAGGMSEGFIQAGFDVAYACDINKDAELTYKNRHAQLGYKVKFACEDIRIFSKKEYLTQFIGDSEVDVVCGGPPCQGFSLAGKRDQNDPRNVLFKHYIETIRNVNPKYFVMENVEGILSMRLDKFDGPSGIVYIEKTVPEILKSEFYELEYKIEYRILQANDFGVPQNRRRVFFFGHKIRKTDEKNYFSLVTPPRFPERNIEKDVPVKDAIDDLAFLESGHIKKRYPRRKNYSKYQLESINGRTPNEKGIPIQSNVLNNHQASRHTKAVIDRFSLLESGENSTQLKQRLGEERWKDYATNKLRCQRIKSNEPSPTVLTLPDDLVHYSKNRIMTVREFARIQSFDDSFEFLGKRTTGGNRRKFELPQYTQVGNAVPPLLAKAIAAEILDAYKNSFK